MLTVLPLTDRCYLCYLYLTKKSELNILAKALSQECVGKMDIINLVKIVK